MNLQSNKIKEIEELAENDFEDKKESIIKSGLVRKKLSVANECMLKQLNELPFFKED